MPLIRVRTKKPIMTWIDGIKVNLARHQVVRVQSAIAKIWIRQGMAEEYAEDKELRPEHTQLAVPTGVKVGGQDVMSDEPEPVIVEKELLTTTTTREPAGPILEIETEEGEPDQGFKTFKPLIVPPPEVPPKQPAKPAGRGRKGNS